MSGEKNPMFGKVPKGEASPNWRGGRSFYPENWVFISLRVKKRDGWRCVRCGSARFKEVHHIDQDPMNCDPLNLVTLCRSCHKLRHGALRRSGIVFFEGRNTP
jgi:5-methylcytosine-specific restriction endonuclease McrA